MEIPGIGPVEKDTKFGWYYSEPIPIPVLGGKTCRIIIDGYDDDPNQDEFHAAIRNFLSIDQSVLRESERYVYQYYKDRNGWWEPDDEEYVSIESPGDVWTHVRLGDEPMVTRRAYGDKGIYVSLECNCDWEIEHGLQIVFKNGLKVNKVGPYDGHLTNSDAFADESLEDVVYRLV